MAKTIIIFLLSFISTDVFPQDTDFDKLTQIKKTSVELPLDYKISRPRLEYPNWDKDFDIYYSFLTPTLRKTQASFSYNQNGVTTTVTPNSIIPHSQLDTTTIHNDTKKLVGTWRMLKFRSIRFNDSVFIPTKKYYRISDTLLDDKSNDEAFAVISDNNFKLYAKESGQNEFKKMMSSKYKVENRRFIMFYKLIKSSAGVSQFGFDENGYLILNYPKVIENVKKGEYFSYYAIVEQYIFEKVK
jgi:hypothetical protein